MPRELADAVQPIVQAGAEHAAARVKSAYPHKTGQLRDGVKVSRRATSDPALVDYVVASTTIYAAAYEFGTQRFKQRAHPTFLPITYEERDKTTATIVDVVRAAGFTVTGDD
jgi:HK97 gp10 family phage protein